MSWAEVIKINSDFVNEPLNFNNYVNDIGIFGANSYVFDKENESLFRALLTSSLTMFGHDAIHEYVYDRLTEADVDVMVEGNGKFGQCMNSYYKTDEFVSGNIDRVLGSITTAGYEMLEVKIEAGVNRYISKKTSGTGVGEWLNEVFETTVFEGYETIDDIMADDALWANTISVNESMRLVISCSAAAIRYAATN